MKLLLIFAYMATIFSLYSDPISLEVAKRKITVDGKIATVYCIVQPDGTFGMSTQKGQNFDVILKNKLEVPTSVHWHGLILPNDQDGVGFVTQYPIYPGLFYHYQFPLLQAGTYWMHSHFSLQEQKLLTAPLIITDADDSKIADKEVVVLLSDFSFKSPEEIFQQLRCKKDMGQMQKKSPDLVEVKYDAMLSNAHTLSDPEIFEVKPKDRVRLRIINGSSATNFFLFLGKLEGEAIAVDGNRIKPLKSSKFELAVAQRIDIVVTINENGAFPILAQAEGSDMQTGFILATKDAKLPLLRSKAPNIAGALNYDQERLMHPLSPLSTKPVDQKVFMELGGNMTDYIWTINGQCWPNVTPVIIEQGKRIEITFKNTSTMSHPMHLHGHVFQVTAIDGKPLQGAMRDTVLVLPNSTLTIQFDASNPGVWPLHCHVLYHQEGGMMTVVRYKDYIQPLTCHYN